MEYGICIIQNNRENIWFKISDLLCTKENRGRLLNLTSILGLNRKVKTHYNAHNECCPPTEKTMSLSTSG